MSKIISIIFSDKYKDDLREINNEILWYDPILKQMKKFNGGHLEFEYGVDPELVENGYSNPYRMIPKVAKSYERIRTKDSNEKDILKWIDDFQNYRNSNAFIISKDSAGIEIEIPDEDIDEFIEDCERKKFNIRT